MRTNFIGKMMIKDQIILHLPTLQAYALEPQQYVFMAFVSEGRQNDAELISPISKEDIEYLLHNGFLTSNVITGVLGLGERGKEVFMDHEEDLNKCFLELYNAYPRAVSDGRGGTRVLRASNPESMDGKACKKKYINILKERGNSHTVILQALHNELKQRGISGQMYMQALIVWLNQRTWEKYLDSLDSPKERGKSL